MNELKIPILTKDEFTDLLLKLLVTDHKDWSIQNVYEYLLDSGFPKLDFERLNDCLGQIFVYLPTVAVDIGDSKFVWVVSGNKAILVEKNKV